MVNSGIVNGLVNGVVFIRSSGLNIKCLIACLMNQKEVRYFKQITDFKGLIMLNTLESSKSRGVFRTQVSIYDGAFLWTILTAYYFRDKISIIDVWLGYI